MAEKRERWHFVGIGGIGMSALAQMALAQGIRVSGSDRGADHPENAALFAALRKQGMAIFPQDGSYVASGRPDRLVWSSAIEEDNPDFRAGRGIPRLHRSQALEQLINASGATPSIAVAGSCGKTSTTAMLAEALAALGHDCECIDGGMIKAFASAIRPGNYRHGHDFLVYEADESDKSLLAFRPDYAVVLNVGTDHYDKAELCRIFTEFVNHAVRGAVLADDVAELIAGGLRPDLKVVRFGGSIGAAACDFAARTYATRRGRSFASFTGDLELELPSVGRHVALNLAATGAALLLCGAAATPEEFRTALSAAHGVRRRFDFAGRMPSGAAVYDDYAHNPEKLACSLAAAQEAAGEEGRVWAVFQPHGYGPFGFMAEELGRMLARSLRPCDRFFLLEPYYAGGTSKFRPTAAEVLEQWKGQNRAEAGGSREALSTLFRAETGAHDVVLILGARDNTLSGWAEALAASPVPAGETK